MTITTFKPRTVPKRIDIPESALWMNSAMAVSKEVNASKVFDSVYYAPGTKEYGKRINDALTGQHVHSQGRTAAAVKDAAAFAIHTSDQGIYSSYAVQPQEFVSKENGTYLEHELECKLLMGLYEKRFPVPKVWHGPKSLLIEHLGYMTFTDLIRNLSVYDSAVEWERSKLAEQFKGEELAKRQEALPYMTTLAKELMLSFGTLMPRMNIAARQILSREDKDKINHGELEELANTFEVSTETAKERDYLLKLMKYVPGAKPEDVSLYEPLETILKDGRERFGIWGLGIHPQNIMITSDRPLQYKVTDFNRPRYGMAQEFDALMFDAFTMKRAPFNVMPEMVPNGQGGMAPVTSLLTPEEQREFVGRAFKVYAKGWWADEDELATYEKYTFPARAYNSIRLAGQSLKDLARAETYQDIISKQFEFGHFYGGAMHNLAVTGNLFGVDTRPLAEHLSYQFMDANKQIMTPELLASTDRWLKT